MCSTSRASLFLLIALLSIQSLCLDERSETYSGAVAVATPAGTPNATGSATVSAIPLHQSGTADYTSPWTLSLSVFEQKGGFRGDGVVTGMALSWPDSQTDLPYGDVCLIFMINLLPDNFTGIDSAAEGSGDCSALLGSGCAQDISDAAFNWGVQHNCTHEGNRLNIFPLPASCEGIHRTSIYKPYISGLRNPTNNSARSSFFEPTDSTNVSTVFHNSLSRIWPMYILEMKQAPGNVTLSAGNLGCVQALNLTNAAVSGSNGGPSTTETSIPASTASQTESSTALASSTPTGRASTVKRGVVELILGCTAVAVIALC